MVQTLKKKVVSKNIRYDIFLSYCVDDRELAQEIEERLKANGLRCFMAEKSLKGGSRWEPGIREALQLSGRVLLLITPRSIKSTWVMLETGAAWMHDIEIVPAVQYVETSELSDIVRGFQAKIIETDAQRTALIHELANIRHSEIYDLTFDAMLEQLRQAVLQMNERYRYHPNLVIGSGRDGGVCAGILAELFGQEAFKVVDCHFRGSGARRVTQLDLSSLQKADIFDKNVLLVEWARQTGETARLIKEAVSLYAPADFRTYALFQTKASTDSPDFFGIEVNTVPSSPWGRIK